MKLTIFPYWFLLAHGAQKTGGARATTTLFFWRKRKTLKKKKEISCFLLFAFVFSTSQGDDSSKWFSFLSFSWTLIITPSQVKLNALIQLMLEMCSLTEEGNGKNSAIKIKDFNQGCWPQIMPSSAKPGQAQPEAIRFSQLKKKNFSGFSPLVLTIERPLQIYQEAQDSPKGGFQNLEFIFFAYLFLLSHRFCLGRSILEKKIEIFQRVRN